MTDREIMQQALAKLEHLWEIGIDAEYKVELLPEIRVLRQALAQPEQEPVAWMLPDYGDVLSASEADGTGIYNIPLYTAPPKREWVGLTGREIELVLLMSGYTAENFARAIEAKLKEKNNAV